MARRIPAGDVQPSVVVIGVPDKAALQAHMERLTRYKIEFVAFHEPDFDMGLSALATVPLTNKQRKAVRHLRLWDESGTTAPRPESQDSGTNGERQRGIVQGQDVSQEEMLGTAPSSPDHYYEAAIR